VWNSTPTVSIQIRAAEGNIGILPDGILFIAPHLFSSGTQIEVRGQL